MSIGEFTEHVHWPWLDFGTSKMKLNRRRNKMTHDEFIKASEPPKRNFRGLIERLFR